MASKKIKHVYLPVAVSVYQPNNEGVVVNEVLKKHIEKANQPQPATQHPSTHPTKYTKYTIWIESKPKTEKRRETNPCILVVDRQWPCMMTIMCMYVNLCMYLPKQILHICNNMLIFDSNRAVSRMQTSQARMRLHLPQRVRLWMVFTKVKANSLGRPVNNNQRGIDIVFGVVLFFFFFFFFLLLFFNFISLYLSVIVQNVQFWSIIIIPLI